MKKSTAIRLTLVSSLAVGAAACGPSRGPEQTFRGYCDPNDETRCESQPRTGYYPMYYPIFWGGYYYDSRGVARTSPGGTVVRNAPASRVGRAAPSSTVSRGGFGSTGAGRGGGYS